MSLVLFYFLQSLLTHVSRPTKNTLNKLGVFTVSSFHAFICARSPSLLNNLLAGRGATKRRPPLLSRSNSGSSRRSMQVIHLSYIPYIYIQSICAHMALSSVEHFEWIANWKHWTWVKHATWICLLAIFVELSPTTSRRRRGETSEI